MIPWTKMPEDLQKAILTMIVVLGGVSASCRLGPVICDPPPPPSTTPMICDPPPPPPKTPEPRDTPTVTGLSPTPASPTPMICDPPPPPPGTPEPDTPTPMICDPPPPPPPTSKPQTALPATVVPGQHFIPRIVEMSSDPELAGAAVEGTITDQGGQRLGGLAVALTGDAFRTKTITDQAGAFGFVVPKPGTYVLAIAGDETNALNLELELHDVAIVAWEETWEDSRAPLPLAELRTVEIVWQDGLTFAAETPWPGAWYRWSASGGRLIEDRRGVIWRPPAEPGRYLLQVVADWGRTGLAVDAAVLTVEDDGSVTLG